MSKLHNLIQSLLGIITPRMKKIFFHSYFYKNEIRAYSSMLKKHALTPNPTLLFISQDAELAGSQMALLTILKWVAANRSFNVRLICLRGGTLLEQYQETYPAILWDELNFLFPTTTKRASALTLFCGEVSCIYGNTVLAPGIYDKLEFLQAPFITHIHELEKSIQRYVPTATLTKMYTFSHAYIACSIEVGENLRINHAEGAKPIQVVPSFIDELTPKLSTVEKATWKEDLNIPVDSKIILGCGTMYWRKGVDFFIETAIRLQVISDEPFHFIWIGENKWDDSNPGKELPSWHELMQKISKAGIEHMILFPGEQLAPFPFFEIANIFYLPSREDPFPLVCLEAASLELPIVCFEGSGGIPAFVGDNAGVCIPDFDVERATERLAYLLTHEAISQKLGKTAKQKMQQNHRTELALPQIVKFVEAYLIS